MVIDKIKLCPKDLHQLNFDPYSAVDIVLARYETPDGRFKSLSYSGKTRYTIAHHKPDRKQPLAVANRRTMVLAINLYNNLQLG